ncbi:integrase family protein [Celeribacter indicus]|uniref:Integrase family protein n=1 Tax=Celeribacter indicus TaxID=1208324 RepID=A0A0B5DY72_9RHOB|nr:integrase family protein [Celeribacter indicus]
MAKIEAVEGKQTFHWDAEVKGFGVRVSAAGVKSYIMQRRAGTTTRRLTIARCDDMGADEARKRAIKLAAQFADGIDPTAEERRRKAQAQTLRQAFNAYKKAPKKKGEGRGAPKKARTIRDVEKMMPRFADWLDKPVTAITSKMVKNRHAEIAATSPAQANLAMRYLRAALNHVMADADDDAPILKSNPVDALNKVHQWAETKRAVRHLPDDRIADWVDAVQTGLVGLKNESEVRDALLFMLLTGARLAEVLGNSKDGYPPLAWADVDLAGATVTFRDTKNRTDHTLPLSAQLVALLAARKAVSGKWVFSDRSGALPGDLRGAYARIEKATGLHITAHDLRRTFATVASRIDISAYKLKRLTNHISGGDVTAGYVQVTTEDLRDAMQRISDRLLSVGVVS